MAKQKLNTTKSSASLALGVKLEAQRTMLGLTYQQVANAADLPKSTVHNILHGKYPSPCLWNVLRVCNALDYPILLLRSIAKNFEWYDRKKNLK